MAHRELNKNDYSVGQMVALKYKGNRARYDKDGYILAKITKIGRKLIHVGDIKIEMETGSEKTDYTPDYELFDSEQDLINELEKGNLVSFIRSEIGQFGECKVSYDKVKAIVEILKENGLG